MGRIKYDINIKPNEFVYNHWYVKFNSEEACKEFNKECYDAGIFTCIIVVKLGIWHAMTDAEMEILNSSKYSKKYSMNWV